MISVLTETSGICQIRNSNYHNLIARKQNRIYTFFAGERVCINYKDDKNINEYRGIITSFNAEGVYLSSFKKKDTTLQYISTYSIISVRNLLRKSRLVSGIITGVSLAATILFSNVNNHNAIDNYAGLFEIFSVAGAVSGTISFLSTFIKEGINTKSLKQGWNFSIQ
jgi:hypothetical protein